MGDWLCVYNFDENSQHEKPKYLVFYWCTFFFFSGDPVWGNQKNWAFLPPQIDIERINKIQTLILNLIERFINRFIFIQTMDL